MSSLHKATFMGTSEIALQPYPMGVGVRCSRSSGAGWMCKQARGCCRAGAVLLSGLQRHSDCLDCGSRAKLTSNRRRGTPSPALNMPNMKGQQKIRKEEETKVCFARLFIGLSLRISTAPHPNNAC